MLIWLVSKHVELITGKTSDKSKDRLLGEMLGSEIGEVTLG